MVIEGEVDGVHAQDILVDMGSAKMMVCKGLVSGEKLMGKEFGVSIRCAHGDSVRYPLARVTMTVRGKSYPLVAAVSETLPVSVLLGRDLPGLVDLLQGTGPLADMLVRTGVQKHQHQHKDVKLHASNSFSGAETTPELEGASAEREDKLFSGGKQPSRLSRRERLKHNGVWPYNNPISLRCRLIGKADTFLCASCATDCCVAGEGRSVMKWSNYL